ncbi:hypothetical protein FDUTEX481_07243 [Tolypothrix sp. PCC 7601]|nr:hypothetical protein FDUTEX481_07243 [Tolypothrix sp. PCC 7601]
MGHWVMGYFSFMPFVPLAPQTLNTNFQRDILHLVLTLDS